MQRQKRKYDLGIRNAGEKKDAAKTQYGARRKGLRGRGEKKGTRKNVMGRDKHKKPVRRQSAASWHRSGKLVPLARVAGKRKRQVNDPREAGWGGLC